VRIQASNRVTLKRMAGKGEIDLFVRSYETLLRSTGEVIVQSKP